MGKLRIDLSNDFGELSVNLDKLVDLENIFLENYLDDASYSLDLTIVDDEQIQFLNKTYRNKDAVTDVLSFADQEVKDLFPEISEEKFLGEIIISYPQLERQAKELDNSLDKEFYLLLSHGVLHLLGYDHIEPEDALKMEAEEDKILKKLFK